MEPSLIVGSIAPTNTRRIATALLCGALVCGTSLAARAAPLGLRFTGEADLAAFGGSSAATLDGTVTWDPALACGPGGGGEGDFPLSALDGSPPCVAATIRINDVARDGYANESSRLMLFPRGMVLQLWFNPRLDLDGGAAPDVTLIELELWRHGADDAPVFADIAELPTDLTFLPRLRDRSLLFCSAGCFEDDECVLTSAGTLAVVPEPASLALLVVGAAAAGFWSKRRGRA